MHAITMDEPGGPERLRWSEVPDPVAEAGEVVLDVAACGVNRADIMQRQGNYPPPPGASEIIGLECSGRIAALGDGVTGWEVGDAVCALLAGGGYAERVAVPAAQLLPLPDGVDLTTAAALPEVACTVWSNVVQGGRLVAGETLLVQGGTSGIGTHAIQVAKALGARVAATAGAADRMQRCRALGADIVIDYHDDIPAELKRATDGHGADVILDNMGAKGLAANVDALAMDGRLMIIGMQGGVAGELNLAKLLAKRASVTAMGLRARPTDGPNGKGVVVAAVREHVWPMIADGRPLGMARVPQSEDGDDDQGLGSMVEQPAKVMRIGTMIKQLLEEVRAAPLDDASRNRLKEVHERSIKELESGLAPELREELQRLSLPFTEDGTPSDAELRIAQAQLVGWLEGLFHGIQTALFAQQMAARSQLEQIRRGLPPGQQPGAESGLGRGTGQYL